MDIKLKNNRKTRIIITAIALAAVTIANLCFFSLIHTQIEKKQEKTAGYDEQVDQEIVRTLYHGCYVLYLEQKQQEAGTRLEAAGLFLTGEADSYSEWDLEEINGTLSKWSLSFEAYRSEIDYYATDGTMGKKNTNRAIEEVLKESPDKDVIWELENHYEYCVMLSFDENGALSIRVQTVEADAGDALVKAFEQADRNDSLQEQIAAYNADNDMEPAGLVAERIRSFTVVYGIPADSADLIYYRNIDADTFYMISDQAFWLYIASFGVLLLLAAVMTSRKIWQDITSFERKGNWYLLEAGCIGMLVFIGLFDGFCDLIYYYAEYGVISFRNFAVNGTPEMVGYLLEIMAGTFAIYGIAYLSILALRPLFSLGPVEYLKQYSFLYQIFPWLKKQWQKFTAEVKHIDFSEKSTKTIVKLVVINFLVLAVLMCTWMFGIFGLVLYSLVLFYLIKRYYDRIAKDYRILMRATSRIAEGDLDTIITEDIGVFEPFKGELFKIRTGFKKAVEAETKSQRMKTELITNVSHDLKTPLTAITTYIELLKKEDITEEERRSYIDTLDRKALRLKVLIEDLFEVSKASSNNITLNLMEVDIVNLMRQVSVEHADKYAAAGITLRWSIPEEKIILMLDNQKTYRIFENLFVNIQKYAMQGSRVYIDVLKEDGRVKITMKNMSAFELNVNAEELTERFVRGDSSRNTEGSGLGLAIAKSFTEAQKGTFAVAVDGDLFKVTIVW